MNGLNDQVTSGSFPADSKFLFSSSFLELSLIFKFIITPAKTMTTTARIPKIT